MSHPSFLAVRLAALALLAASLASAAALPEMDADGSVALPGKSVMRLHDPSVQASLEAGGTWRNFRSSHGEWSALWNEATGTPHRAFGRPIALSGFRDDAASVDQAVRSFVAANPDLFGGSPTLESASTVRAGDVWYARFRQRVNGLPVLFSDWEFRVGSNGKLFAFGADAHHPATAVRSRPVIAAAVAREAATAGLAFDAARDRVRDGDGLALLPLPAANGFDYRVVYSVEVDVVDPPGRWETYVDASSGEVLYRQNRIRYDISGHVTGPIHPTGPNDAPVTRNFPHLVVRIDGIPVATDTTGFYSGTGGNPALVDATFNGLYSAVSRQDGGVNAEYSLAAPNPSTVDISWGAPVPSIAAERDAYYHVNVVHDYAKRLDPSLTGIDYGMPVAIEVAGTCNAFWDGFGVNFYAAGGGCPDISTIPDVIYHEYGHGINDWVYRAHGLGGMDNGALHEGMADVNSSFLRDDSRIGVDFQGPGTILRNTHNTKHWPQDESSDPHMTGLIIAGAFWDLRLAVGLPVAEHLAHFAKHGTPDDPDDGIAMSEFFLETLIADDDNADLTDGTPHSSDIIAAFNAHGIGTGFFLNIAHVPLGDQPAGGSAVVSAQITYSGPIGALDASSPAVHYSINHGAYSAAALMPTGNPNEFAGGIVAPAGSIVTYFISAADNFGQEIDRPFGPANTYVVGPTITVASTDVEVDPGWSTTAIGDNAATGRWVRADPVGSFIGSIVIQPEDDHTPAGTMCYVTGNAAIGAVAGTNDVDGGHTTLTTTTFNATTGGIAHPMVEYYRWYSNDQGGAPSSDFWVVDISNDNGTNWTHVENTLQSDAAWLRVVFRIEDYVTPTSTMKLRFIAADEGAGSLVEAAVDDFRLFGFPAAVLAVGGPPAAAHELALAPAMPNPFRSSAALSFTLPAAGAANLRVYDLSGRSVRTLASGSQSAGAHTLEWNGRDDVGRPLPSGAYFLRLQSAGRELVRRIVFLK